MLKEEKELRDWANDGTIQRRRKIGEAITALVRAVREDCAKVAEFERCGILPEDSKRDIIVRAGIAAAIRGRK